MMTRKLVGFASAALVAASMVSTPMAASAAPTPVVSGTIAGSVAENGSLTLSAPAGSVFTAVVFASYGTPTTTPPYALGGCHADNSVAIVAGYFVGQATATIPATNTVFGDPCGGTYKRLSVELAYSSSVNAPMKNRKATTGSCASASGIAAEVSKGLGAERNAFSWCADR